MTKHTRTAPLVTLKSESHMDTTTTGSAEAWRRRQQRQADAALDQAAPLRYVPSMGKRLKASEWSDSMKKTAHEALVAWNKP